LYGKNPPFPQFLILSSQYNELLMLELLLNYLKDLKLLNLFKSLEVTFFGSMNQFPISAFVAPQIIMKKMIKILMHVHVLLKIIESFTPSKSMPMNKFLFYII
jgi:hypothetical protein